MCLGGKKTTTSSSTTLDPELQSLLTNNYNATKSATSGMSNPYTGQLTAGFTPDQLSGQGMLKGIAANNVGGATLNQATGTAGGVAGYTPNQITAGQLSNTDLSPYMNPYQQNVIDTTLAQLEKARQGGLMTDNQSATTAGAFGGDRQAVVNSLTNRDFMDTTASTLANLNSQNFQQAQGAAGSDIDRALSAAGSNQNAGLQGAGLNLQGAGLLGQLSQQQLDQATQRAGLVSGVGDAQLAQKQKELDAGYQEFLRQMQAKTTGQQLNNQSLGLFPALTSTNSTSKEQGGELNGILGSLGSVAQGLGAMGVAFSDVRLKTNIVPFTRDARGRDWFTYRYIWDDAATLHMGVMAQGVRATDPEAVIEGADGFLRVDYSMLEAA